MTELYIKKNNVDINIPDKNVIDSKLNELSSCIDGMPNNHISSPYKIIVASTGNKIGYTYTLPSNLITHQDISGKVDKADVTDNVTNGDMNPVTSNAVYDYIDNIMGDINDYITS